VREALFSTFGSLGAIDDAVVLDLYAGSGALGLEAVSRGAREAVLVERSAPAAADLRASSSRT
jgi:16S rRNA (guanine966-N2)-methyltransferase